MKLLLVHQKLGHFGGAEANIRTTAAELRRRGHLLGLAYLERTGRAECEWANAFDQVYALESESPWRRLEAVIRRESPEAIYLHTISNLEVLRGLADCGRPVVRMVHDHEMYCLRGYKYHPLTRQVCSHAASWRCVFPCLAPLKRTRGSGAPFTWQNYAAKRREITLNRRFSHFVVYSEFARMELIKNGFDGSRVTIHVPVAGDGPVVNASFSDRNLLVAAGQVIRGKGFDVLLRALAQVQAQYQCVILGDGHHRASCERLSARLGLDGRVQFRGYVPPQELAAHYREASTFLLSSVWPEPFGMVGPEAMRFGLPVVAFDAGGIGEWLQDGENGFLVPWMDTASYARRVEQLLRDKPLARRLGERGRAMVTEKYGTVRQVDILERIFTQVTQPPRHSYRTTMSLEAAAV